MCDLRDSQSEGSSVLLHDAGGGLAAASPPPWPGSPCAHTGSPPGWRTTPGGSARGSIEYVYIAKKTACMCVNKSVLEGDHAMNLKKKKLPIIQCYIMQYMVR